MALFGFSDITFNKGSSGTRGPLSSLVDSKYETNTLRYPLDLGNWDKAHYLVFYIRKQKRTSSNYVYGQGNDGDLDAKISSSPMNLSNINGSFSNELLSKLYSGLPTINNITGGSFSNSINNPFNIDTKSIGNIDNVFNRSNNFFGGNGELTSQIIDNSIKKITGGSLDFLKTTSLTTDAIALYMPDTLNYTYTQNYENTQLGGELAGQFAAAAKSAYDAYVKEGGLTGAQEAASSISKSAALLTGAIGSEKIGGKIGQNTAKLGFSAVTGFVSNPMLELIYKTPNFRTFQFEFIFYPRDEKEAYEVQRIIERLRFHQAPELAQESQGFLVPPSEFDIRFYYAGAQNPNIPQIATCVLTNIDTNYAPNGWYAYEVPGENKPSLGRTGMPTSIQLTLQFQETTYLTKSDFNDKLAIGGR